jgi:Rrf2 family protein
MITLSAKFFYAVEAVLTIAYNANNAPVNGRDIAARQRMQPRHLEQVMQKLVRARILRGVRGPHGGYLLAREKRRITLADIKEAIGEDETLPSSTPLGNHVVAPALKKIQQSLTARLQEITLARLYEQATEKNIRRTANERNDFTI